MLIPVTMPVEHHTVTKIGDLYYVGLYDCNGWWKVITTDDPSEIDKIVEGNPELSYNVNPYLQGKDSGDFDDMGRSAEAGKHFGMNKHEDGRL